MKAADADEIVRRFVRDGHLVALPAREAKRRLVLERIAQSFEPGVYYPEREVDAILKAWTDGGNTDHATVRRYLVDHGLLARGHGEYWRSGGWIDVLGDEKRPDRPGDSPSILHICPVDGTVGACPSVPPRSMPLPPRSSACCMRDP